MTKTSSRPAHILFFSLLACVIWFTISRPVQGEDQDLKSKKEAKDSSKDIDDLKRKVNELSHTVDDLKAQLESQKTSFTAFKASVEQAFRDTRSFFSQRIETHERTLREIGLRLNEHKNYLDNHERRLRARGI